MSRKLVRRGLFLAAIGIVTFTTTQASAAITDNLYPTQNTRWSCFSGQMNDSYYCQTDNSTLTVFIQPSIIPAGKDKIRSRLNTQYNPTDLTVQYAPSPITEGSAETDIIYEHNTRLPDPLSGIVWCNNSVNSIKCDQHYARFRAPSPGSKTICHETGHAVGLTHGLNASPQLTQTDTRLGCMTTPSGSTTLGPQNIEMINSIY